MSTATIRALPRRKGAPLQTRSRLLIGGALAVFIALWAMAQVWNAYTTSYTLFQSIAQDSSIKVDAAQQAVQYIGSVDTAAADEVNDTTPSDWDGDEKNMTTDFQHFRDQMFILRQGLEDQQGTKAYNTYLEAEQLAYDKYWQQIGLLIANQRKGDHQAGIDAFLAADSYMEKDIIPRLQTLGDQNFGAMRQAGNAAVGVIVIQAVLLGILAIGVAALLTGLSFWLRTKIRRILTPGLDAAVVLVWVLTLAMLFQLAQLPGRVHRMTDDAYLSITAVSRALDDANAANRTESAEFIDINNAPTWQDKFTKLQQSVQLRMCGQIGCISQSFLLSSTGTLDPKVARNATKMSPADSQAINGVVPLVANVTFPGEDQALEDARKIYADYLNMDQQMRDDIKAGKVADALAINNDPSDKAFHAFSDAMEKERKINHDVFDQVWATEQNELPTARLWYGVVGFAVVILLLGAGVYQRYQEL